MNIKFSPHIKKGFGQVTCSRNLFSYIKSLNDDTHQTAIGIINYLLYRIL